MKRHAKFCGTGMNATSKAVVPNFGTRLKQVTTVLKLIPTILSVASRAQSLRHIRNGDDMSPAAVTVWGSGPERPASW